MKLGRHKGVEVCCQYCGNKFMALAQRVEQGMGRFCSMLCCNNWQRENRVSAKLGKENAKVYLKQDGSYFVQWVMDNGKPKNMLWHNWAWEINFGEIPSGYVVEYIDGNKSNIVLENLQLRLTRRGKQSQPKIRKEMTQEHKNKISLAVKRRWDSGAFDFHKGSSNPNWNPKKVRHPKEFSKDLKEFIRNRNNHICQICGVDLLGKRQPVHHIDGDKFNNSTENLILFCTSCHLKVHFEKGMTSPTIMAFRWKLQK